MIPSTRAQRQRMKTEAAARPLHLVPVPQAEWGHIPHGDCPVEGVWLSRGFLVVAYDDQGLTRLSINRTELSAAGHWGAEISWDELQDLKRQAGFGDRLAVEVYPRDHDVINVANMRHLWLMPEDVHIGWYRSP